MKKYRCFCVLNRCVGSLTGSQWSLLNPMEKYFSFSTGHCTLVYLAGHPADTTGTFVLEKGTEISSLSFSAYDKKYHPVSGHCDCLWSRVLELKEGALYQNVHASKGSKEMAVCLAAKSLSCTPALFDIVFQNQWLI